MSTSLPAIDLCLTCHETAITDNPEEEKIPRNANERSPESHEFGKSLLFMRFAFTLDIFV